MKVKFIHWEASWNLAQEMYNEKYPHYGLLLHAEDDTCTVLFFTQDKEMVFEIISRKETDFVELVEVEIPYELYENAVKYLDARRELHGFSDEFLAYVAKYRGMVEKVDDVLAEADGTARSPEERLLDRISSDDVVQPFPRNPTGP